MPLDVSGGLGSPFELGSLLNVDSDASIDFDLSLAFARARHRSRSRDNSATALANISNVSGSERNCARDISTAEGNRRSPNRADGRPRTPAADQSGRTSQFVGSSFGDTMKSGRRKIKKAEEWEDRLRALDDVFRGLSVRSVDTVDRAHLGEVLSEGFGSLAKVLSSLSSAQRPASVFPLINVYALNLVKLQQFALALRVEGSDAELCSMVHETLSQWLNARERLREEDRSWAHTRHVLSLMLRHVHSFGTLLALKHNLSSMLTELLAFVAKDDDQRYAVYACELLERLSSILTQQMIFADKDKLF